MRIVDKNTGRVLMSIATGKGADKAMLEQAGKLIRRRVKCVYTPESRARAKAFYAA